MNPNRKFIQELTFDILEKLRPESQALWGVMGPQHMVEHLSLVFKLANGKTTVPLITPIEKLERYRQAVLIDQLPFPQGVKVKGIIGDEPAELHFPDLLAAKVALRRSVDAFYAYFEANPEAQLNHPKLGLLNFEEWEIFFRLHNVHHLTQFGLMGI